MYRAFQRSLVLNRRYRMALLVECLTFLHETFCQESCLNMIIDLPDEERVELCQQFVRQCDKLKVVFKDQTEASEVTGRGWISQTHQMWLEIGASIEITTFALGPRMYDLFLGGCGGSEGN